VLAELRHLTEEEDAAMRQADLIGPRPGAAPYQPGGVSEVSIPATE
jgi:hypothetical protein